MFKTVSLLVLGVIAAVAVSDVPDDSIIVDAIGNALVSDRAVNADVMSVYVSDGIVRLCGTLSSLKEADRAVEVARSIKGVRSVINLVHVSRPAGLSDRVLGNAIAGALAVHPATGSYELTVSVRDGLATVSGTVRSWAEKELVDNVVLSVEGVAGLANMINVVLERHRDDDEIRWDIIGRMDQDPIITRRMLGSIRVTVKDGIVRINGVAGNPLQRKRLVEAAAVTGVRGIDMEGLLIKTGAGDMMRKSWGEFYPDDREIEKGLRAALAQDPRLAGSSVTVRSGMGRVLVQGAVISSRAHWAVIDNALNTTGVWAVDDRVTVSPRNMPTDAILENLVGLAFARNPVLAGHCFGIRVEEGRATLYGAADSPFEIMLAQRTAQAIPGVFHVESGIRIDQAEAWKTDEAIKEELKKALAWDDAAAAELIGVTVVDRAVIFFGSIPDRFMLIRAVRMAFAAGAVSAECRLWVRIDPARINEPYVHVYAAYPQEM